MGVRLDRDPCTQCVQHMKAGIILVSIDPAKGLGLP